VDRYLWTDANPIGRLPKRLGGPPAGMGGFSHQGANMAILEAMGRVRNG
jgi:hypothetical protein